MTHSEREPLENVFSRLADKLFRYALFLLHQPQDAEEAIQDVFLSLVRRRPSDHLTDGYFFAAVRKRCCDKIREKNRRPPSDDIDLIDLSAQTPGPDRETCQVIQEALGGISTDQREVIVLKIFCALTFSEIAQLLQLSIQYHRGSLSLRASASTQAVTPRDSQREERHNSWSLRRRV